MRKVAICFSIFQFPRYGIHTLANSWRETFPNLIRDEGYTSSFKILGSDKYGLDRRQYRRSSRRMITTKTQGRNRDILSSKTNIKNEILEETRSSNLNAHRTTLAEVKRTQVFDIREKISENKELAKLVTFIAFDIETTGFSRREDRIIEIALQDFVGGKNSTFQTLVNPKCYVPNSHIHGISTHMVNRPHVPRMEDLIPFLLQYVKSRQKQDGCVVLIAHNARSFDVPFLSVEFSRCSYKIPEDWLFVDTLPLAREVMKCKGLKGASRLSLQALRDLYEIPLIGSAHRALADVKMLSLILQRMTFDLKLARSSLIEKYSFSELELRTSKKKRSSG